MLFLFTGIHSEWKKIIKREFLIICLFRIRSGKRSLNFQKQIIYIQYCGAIRDRPIRDKSVYPKKNLLGTNKGQILRKKNPIKLNIADSLFLLSIYQCEKGQALLCPGYTFLDSKMPRSALGVEFISDALFRTKYGQAGCCRVGTHGFERSTAF